MSQHGLEDCQYWDELSDRAIDLDGQINPQPDTCCFECYLPTKVCKGPLLRGEGDKCYSPFLILSFWVICSQIPLARWVDDPYGLKKEWLPRAWQPSNFSFPAWDLDTEMIRAALLFYRFAKRYWGQQGWY